MKQNNGNNNFLQTILNDLKVFTSQSEEHECV